MELHEGVEKGEILTNNDGNFQMSVDLDFSSVTSEDWKRYDCVFQLSGLNEDIVTKLDKNAIKTNWGKPSIRSDGGKKQLILLSFLCFILIFNPSYPKVLFESFT